MDNIITGALGITIFVAFVAGLAKSIGALPFILIVAIVVAMAGYDFWESARAGLREERARKAGRN